MHSSPISSRFASSAAHHSGPVPVRNAAPKFGVRMVRKNVAPQDCRRGKGLTWIVAPSLFKPLLWITKRFRDVLKKFGCPRAIGNAVVRGKS